MRAILTGSPVFTEPVIEICQLKSDQVLAVLLLCAVMEACTQITSHSNLREDENLKYVMILRNTWQSHVQHNFYQRTGPRLVD